ncbi:PREDICTED: protein spire homolog 1-like isoform X2 [Poecilia mexicana]|uniref:KIND domain-containing protein n=1 Tax=Poecilia mexicana TaxID=48701 RepID=A0A3B3XW27_9TELE|nr:PREDICTED: protein spire homolog 1-like isoform X2 [Poecilia mexicana]
MAKRPGSKEGTLSSSSPTVLRNLNRGDVSMDCGDGSEDLSLDEILTLYSQPINEEQAWAVCYQCCRTLAQKHRRRGSSKAAGSSAVEYPRKIDGPGNVRIGRDGAVKLHFEGSKDEYQSACTSLEVIYSLGVMIYKALDYGLKENEERELSPPLERLIDMMTNMQETETDPCPDEGYEATEEEDECEEDDGDEELDSVSSASEVSSIKSYRDVLLICSSHLPSPSDAPNHYLAVCRALYAETRELHTFLEKIRCAKENLRRMEGETQEEPEKDLNELQNADWARFWVQVMRDLRHGVKLKKVQERQYNPLPIEYQLTPYEMLMDDIRSKRYKLRKVMVNGDIPPRLKKSAHEIILEFIRSRPPLNPVSARKLKPHPPRPRSLHERLLEDIKAERKLRPVSPDMIRRHRLDGQNNMKPPKKLLGAGKSISTPQDLFRSPASPDGQRKLAGSTHSLASGMTGTPQRAQQLSQRKRLLKAPTLAELDSSESEEEPTKSSSSRSTSLLEDMSPETAAEKKAPPKFLPVSATPQPEKHQALQRRHSVEREAPAFVRSFAPPSKQSSKSLVEAAGGAQVTEEFGYPVECLTLTVEEVMHIRQVLVKAELEKFQQYKDVYNALKKGKLCFACRTKKFSLFTWSYTCQFCKRPVCAQCSKKIRLPSKPYSTLPIYSLGPSAGAKDVTRVASAPPEPEKHAPGYGRHSLRRRLSKHSSRDGQSKDELELPKELTEDWVAMEVCVDCKKFITEIICSSKRSLSVASKRARLNRKTQSFYMPSSKSASFHPAERPISEM